MVQRIRGAIKNAKKSPTQKNSWKCFSHFNTNTDKRWGKMSCYCSTTCLPKKRYSERKNRAMKKSSCKFSRKKIFQKENFLSIENRFSFLTFLRNSHTNTRENLQNCGNFVTRWAQFNNPRFSFSQHFLLDFLFFGFSYYSWQISSLWRYFNGTTNFL